MSNKIRLIGFTGLAGVGKDTISDLICEWSSEPLFHKVPGIIDDRPWTKMAFADALKDICVQYLGLTDDDVHTQKGKGRFNYFWGMTNRTILQLVGTEAFRNGFANDVWVRILEMRLKKHLENGLNAVVCDCRFDNEAAMIRRLGGIVINIDRPGLNTALSSNELSHKSECGISDDLIDFTIVNDGTPEEMISKIEKIVCN